MAYRRSVLAAVIALLVAGVAEATSPSSLRVLGPLPLPPPPGDGLLAPETELVMEIDPRVVDPWVDAEVILDPGGPVRWREVAVGGDGSLEVDKAGVYWLASRLEVDRWTRLELSLAGGGAAALFVDAEELARREAAADEPLKAVTPAARGSYLVLARVEISEAAAAQSILIAASTEGEARLQWTVERTRPITRLADSVAVAAVDHVVVDLKGERVARRVTRRSAGGEVARSSVEVLDRGGRVLFASLGDESAVPLGFSPRADANVLLLRQDGDDGSDLVLFDLDTADLRTVVRDEPDLGFVRWGPGGSHLLLASARGVKEDPQPDDAARRRRALRERLPDYNPRRHLHLVEIATGARRRVTAPGDWVVDDAHFVGARRSVVYARTVPRADRPWFATEIRLLHLVTGEDRLVTTFVSGWECRPHGLVADSRGKQLAFLGPPVHGDQLGSHNPFQTAIWLLDLDSGELQNLTAASPHAFGGSGDMLVWKHDNRWLLATVTEGSRTRLARVSPGPMGWTVELLEAGAETVSEAGASGQGLGIGFVAASRNLMPRLQYLDLEANAVTVLEAPNHDLADRLRVTPAEDAAFTGPGGERVDAWWYRSAARSGTDRIPLVVYFYGGTEPTLRRFSFEHQVLAGNGYVVLVVNPRGAIGYGQAFADHHVSDWGPKAAADVLAGVDAFLASHPEVDGGRVGIYGGSFGGFLVEYLVANSERFAAAVSLFGIANIGSYWGAGAWGWTYGDVALSDSYPWSAAKMYVERSPLFSADRIRTPLLLLHGEADVNVPPEESEQLYTALEVLGRPVELVRFPREDHGIDSTWNRRVERGTMVLEWFDAHLRGEPGGWEARWEQERQGEDEKR